MPSSRTLAARLQGRELLELALTHQALHFGSDVLLRLVLLEPCSLEESIIAWPAACSIPGVDDRAHLSFAPRYRSPPSHGVAAVQEQRDNREGAASSLTATSQTPESFPPNHANFQLAE